MRDGARGPVHPLITHRLVSPPSPTQRIVALTLHSSGSHKAMRLFATIALLLSACSTSTLPDGQINSAVDATRTQRKKIVRKKTSQPAPPSAEIPDLSSPLELSPSQWRARLSPEQFEIMREGGTELPYTGSYLEEKRAGVYHCAACNNPLFSSDTKFDSRTGWPSFYDRIDEARVITQPDERFDMARTEVLCGHCKAHLGHVFDDGPQPTGLRYCVNSTSLYFRPN